MRRDVWGAVLATSLAVSCAGVGQDVGQSKEPVVVAGDKLEQSAHCEKGLPIRITANNSRLSILGPCTVVRVEGSRNWMTVQHARRIVTAGNGNTVLYDDRSTEVQDKGNANSVMERWPQ